MEMMTSGINAVFGVLFVAIAVIVSRFNFSEKWFIVAIYLGLSMAFLHGFLPVGPFSPIIGMLLIAFIEWMDTSNNREDS